MQIYLADIQNIFLANEWLYLTEIIHSLPIMSNQKIIGYIDELTSPEQEEPEPKNQLFS